MQAEGWPVLQWERFPGESLQAYRRRVDEIEEILQGFRMSRYRGEVAEKMERRLVDLQEQSLERLLLSA